MFFCLLLYKCLILNVMIYASKVMKNDSFSKLNNVNYLLLYFNS